VNLSTPARPVPGDSPAWRFPSAQRHSLASGLEVIACHLPDRPVIDLRVILDGGSGREDRARAGLAAITARSLVEGTELRGAAAFNEALELLGGHVHALAHWNGLVVNFTVPRSQLLPGLELLTELLAAPGLRDDDIARLIRRRIDETVVENLVPQARAFNAFSSAIFASTSRLALPANGDAASVAGLVPEMAKAWWAAFACPARATLLVTGDLRGVELETLLDKSVRHWTAPKTEGAEPVVAAAATEPKTVLVDFPQGVQTTLVVGHAFERVAYDDLPAVKAAAHILGGYFSSRLITKLREERSITYAAQAAISDVGPASMLMAMTAVEQAATVEAIAVILDEIGSLGETLDDEEVRRATDNLVRRGPTAYKTVDAVASSRQSMVLNNHPDDHVDRFRERLGQLTAADVSEALARSVTPGHLSVVAAGPASKIGDGIRALRGELCTEL
jgi:predicted Zn-dependent peptidase